MFALLSGVSKLFHEAEDIDQGQIHCGGQMSDRPPVSIDFTAFNQP